LLRIRRALTLALLCLLLLLASSFSAYARDLRPPLHSFPTRRSSDLPGQRRRGRQVEERVHGEGVHDQHSGDAVERDRRLLRPQRSEEHTSELQSRFDLVCRLLLEKKKGGGASRRICYGNDSTARWW